MEMLRSLFTRDHIVWSLGFVATVLVFIVGNTTTLIPEAYVKPATEIAAVLAFIAGKLGNSPLPGR